MVVDLLPDPTGVIGAFAATSRSPNRTGAMDQPLHGAAHHAGSQSQARAEPRLFCSAGAAVSFPG